MDLCNECGRSNCDCEVMTLDIYGTEIVGGEKYAENDSGECIHPESAFKYLLEHYGYKLKTR